MEVNRALCAKAVAKITLKNVHMHIECVEGTKKSVDDENGKQPQCVSTCVAIVSHGQGSKIDNIIVVSIFGFLSPPHDDCRLYCCVGF